MLLAPTALVSRQAGSGRLTPVAGMHQHYSCRNCDYAGSVEAPANAAQEILLEAARSDHAERSPDCSSPSIELGSSSSGLDRT